MRPELFRELVLTKKAIGSVRPRLVVQQVEYNKWHVRFHHRGRLIDLGLFGSEKEATKAYLDKKKELKGKADEAKAAAAARKAQARIDAAFQKEHDAFVRARAKKTTSQRLSRHAKAKIKRRELREQYEAERKARRQEAKDLVAQYLAERLFLAE